MTNFFGRNSELKKLRELLKKDSASLVVIKGRRRIGKSRLALEFGKDFKKCYTFSGIPPSKNLTAQEERNDFSSQMSRALKIPQFETKDWGDLLYYLSKEAKKGRILIVLDEINWMGNKDHTFLGKLKTAWDQFFSKNPELIMILCGSLSGWIEKNILTNTGFVGRISKTFTLRELPLHICNLFWKENRDHVSSYEKFKFLSISGGIPKYLEEMLPQKTAEENIFNLAFQSDGFLFREFDQLFHDLFSKKSARYKNILKALSEGPKGLDVIYKALNLKKTGYIVSEYMDDLEEAGFIQRDFTWGLGSNRKSKLSAYRLSDNYSRFYLKYIEPRIDRIKQGTLTKIPSYEGILGLQFENLVLNNRKSIYDLLEIDPGSIIIDNPYFQNNTKNQSGCQIDYMIQTEHEILYPFEIKFSKKKIQTKVTQEVKEKMKKLSPQKGLSVRPVLIHVNGVSELVKKSKYFTHIIDFSDFLSFRPSV
ncbi:MAG: ATP-binding protein [Chlamydiota bacterium]